MDPVVPALDRRQGRAPRDDEFPTITEVPSFYFHRNVHATFIDEPMAVQNLRYELGVRNMLWSTDYPHPVTSWPNSCALAEASMAGVPADERELMLSPNSARVWNL